MKISLRQRGVRAVVLDIEGTTTPISFVYDVLFPYVRTHLRAFLAANAQQGAVRDAVDLLRQERGPTDLNPDIAGYVESLMDSDSKSSGLKLLQGKIWEDGYADGSLRGVVFSDVPPALHRWRHADIELAIYSSGSVLAQRLLFGTTPSGDLTPLIRHYFDTEVGAKRAAQSYERISRRIGYRPQSLLFISDIVAELDAARTAGFQTALCVRPGNAPQPAGGTEVIRDFGQIVA